MLRDPIKTPTAIVIGVSSVLLMLVAYSVLSSRMHSKNPDDRTIPTWSQQWEGVKQIFTPHHRSGERWVVVDSKATAKRLFLGLGVGGLASVIIGMLMGCFAAANTFFSPVLTFLSKIPPTAILAVFFVLVGTDLEMFVAMVAFGVLPSFALSVNMAVREVPNEMIYKSYTLGASHAEVAWNVIFRAVFPKILDNIRLQIGPAMVYLIAAEMLCADEGFGYRLRLQSRLLNMQVVYPYLVLLAAFGFGMDTALRQLQRWLCPWYAKGAK